MQNENQNPSRTAIRGSVEAMKPTMLQVKYLNASTQEETTMWFQRKHMEAVSLDGNQVALDDTKAWDAMNGETVTLFLDLKEDAPQLLPLYGASASDGDASFKDDADAWIEFGDLPSAELPTIFDHRLTRPHRLTRTSRGMTPSLPLTVPRLTSRRRRRTTSRHR